MKNLKIAIVIILVSGVLISGCGINRFQAFKHNFLVYPNEIREQDIDRNNPREILFGQKYSILMIEKKNGEVFPVQHYWPEHTFTFRVWPKEVSWSDPLSISSNIIVDDIALQKNGIAIKRDSKDPWRVYWFTKESIKTIEKNERLLLPPYQSLSLLDKHNP
jgi:hypothetical protein